MKLLAFILGITIIGYILWDAFETIIMPRTLTRRFRLTRLLYSTGWKSWTALGRRIVPDNLERHLVYFGPLSLPALLSFWAVAMIVSFALIQWSLGPRVVSPERPATFTTCLYMSGATVFTLGYGDVVPRGAIARFFAILEAGTGFGFLAIVIGYFPVIYQAFSRREANISMLDSRASSPPTATEFLRRHSAMHERHSLMEGLRDWEQWAAELLESHLSYPVLAFYRSQHEGESWLAALTCIMDTCALLSLGEDGPLTSQARLTFAMTRHAVVDLAWIFDAAPVTPKPTRLSQQAWRLICQTLQNAGMPMDDSPPAWEQLSETRLSYEPIVQALSLRFLLTLPPWLAPTPTTDNWRTSAWESADTTVPHFN